MLESLLFRALSMEQLPCVRPCTGLWRDICIGHAPFSRRSKSKWESDPAQNGSSVGERTLKRGFLPGKVRGEGIS